MTNISFDRPYLLLLAIPLLLITLIPFFIAIRKTNRSRGAVASLILHIFLSLIISLVASGASISRVITETNVVVIADVSHSTSDRLDTIDSYIKEVEGNLPDNSKMSVIAFGKNSSLVTQFGESFTTVKGAKVDNSSTNIKAALTRAASLFTGNAVRRIVLITDAKDTSGMFDGAIATIDALHNAEVYIDAIYIDSNTTSSDKEVELSSVDYNPSTFKGHETYADVLIQSSSSESIRATVTLSLDGEVIATKNELLTEGFNVSNIKIPTEAPGEFIYTVEVKLDNQENDTSTYNNSYTFSQSVAENIRVLLVSSKNEDVDALKKYYPEGTAIDAYINNPDVPCSTEELIGYDEYVISDTDIRNLNNSKSFINTIESLVSSYGKSLLTFGDLSLQNKHAQAIPGENEDGAENEAEDSTDPVYDTITGMLPVNFGNSDQDSKLLCLVIDTSRSMQFMNKLDIAKNAALQLVNVMNDKDFLVIVSFSGDFNTEWPVSQIDGNREKISEVINGLEPSQGTVLGKGMQEAYDKLTGSSIENKQVFLISDGRTWAEETDDAVETATKLYDLGIPTSVLNTATIAQAGDNASYDAVTLLNNIALAGRGGEEEAKNYFFANDPKKVSDLVLGEVADMLTETIIEDEVSVKIELGEGNLDKDKLESALPHLLGYVFAREQSTATTVLTTEYETTSGAKIIVPIYAYRRYDRGRVSSFTSSLSGEWVSLWQNNTNGNAGGDIAFNQIIDSATPKTSHSYPFNLQISESDGAYLITIIPERLRFDAEASIIVKSPSGKSKTHKLPFTSNGFSYLFTTDEIGYFDITASYTENGKTHEAKTSLYIPYLPEYNEFTLYSISNLHRLIRTKGEVHENSDFEMINNKEDIETYTFYLALPLMILAVAIFVIDIILRKLRWQDIVTLFSKKRKKEGVRK